MTRQPWTSGRRAAAVLICAGAVTVALGLLFDSVLDHADKFGSVIGAVVAVAGLVVQLRSARSVAAGDADRAAALLDRLAERLREDWRQEWRRRRLHDPGPMPVAWVNADELADHPHTITRSTDRDRPIPVLDGTFTDLTDTFLGLPRRRLVVIGPGGQGKSSLCLHLARELLERRPDGRLPVLVGLSGWQPDTTDLDRWLADTLTTDVAPALDADSGDGRSWAVRLIAEGRFVPLLDGLDELPEELRGRAIERINDADLGPLMLTCREQEYSATVRELRDVVSAAAVVRLVPLAPSSVAEWLDDTTAPLDRDRAAWRDVVAAAGQPGAEALAEVLTSPLMVTMARAVYGHGTADPAALLAMASAPREDIERHLLAQLVPTAFRDLPRSVRGRGPAPHRIESCLGAIARHLSAAGADRIEWWRLHTMVPRWPARLIKATLVALVAVAAQWLSLLVSGLPLNPWFLVIGAVMFGGSTVITHRADARRAPKIVRLSIRPAVRHSLTVLRGFAERGLVVGLVVGVPILLGVLLLAGLRPAQLGLSGSLLALLAIGVLAAAIGLGLALAFGLPLAAVDAFTTPVDIGQAVQPRSLAGADQVVSLARGCVFGIVVGVTLFPSAMYLVYGISLGMSAVPAASTVPITRPVLATLTVQGVLTIAVPAALAFLLTSTAWGQFAFARLYLTVTRRFPFALLALLDEARDRGVLRQNGAAYLFRHERLQTQLTEAAEAAALSRRRARPAGHGSVRRRPA